MDADIVPPNAQSVGVTRFIWPRATFPFQAPFVAIMIQPDRGHQLLLSVLMNFPSPHVMAAGHDAGLDAFGHPRAHDEISNFSLDAHQIAGAHTERGRMTRVQPKRIRMRDL